MAQQANRSFHSEQHNERCYCDRARQRPKVLSTTTLRLKDQTMTRNNYCLHCETWW